MKIRRIIHICHFSIVGEECVGLKTLNLITWQLNEAFAFSALSI